MFAIPLEKPNKSSRSGRCAGSLILIIDFINEMSRAHPGREDLLHRSRGIAYGFNPWLPALATSVAKNYCLLFRLPLRRELPNQLRARPAKLTITLRLFLQFIKRSQFRLDKLLARAFCLLFFR